MDFDTGLSSLANGNRLGFQTIAKHITCIASWNVRVPFIPGQTELIAEELRDTSFLCCHTRDRLAGYRSGHSWKLYFPLLQTFKWTSET